MKRIAVGILAHVDAGKTTLSEGLLYASGEIRKLGRVDAKETFLDSQLYLFFFCYSLSFCVFFINIAHVLRW